MTDRDNVIHKQVFNEMLFLDCKSKSVAKAIFWDGEESHGLDITKWLHSNYGVNSYYSWSKKEIGYEMNNSWYAIPVGKWIIVESVDYTIKTLLVMDEEIFKKWYEVV